MGEEKEKKKKKKKDKKKDEEAPPAVDEPAEGEEGEKSGSKKKSSKKKSTKKASGPLSIFSEDQLKDFKAGFNYMDQDRDGIITKTDLFRTYDIIGKLASDEELDKLLMESENPLTFTQFLTMFAEKMEGKADDDDLIIESIKAFDEGDGTIDDEQLEAVMQGKGDAPLTKKECNEVFPDLPRVDERPHARFITVKGFIELLVNKEEEQATEYETDAEWRRDHPNKEEDPTLTEIIG